MPSLLVALTTVLAISTMTPDELIIQDHLAHAEATLRARDVSHLTPELRAARAANLDLLHDYWTAGVFPRNTDFPGHRLPYFIDREGVPCAMAHLVIASGFSTEASAISRRENNAYIHDMQSPELGAWIAQSGLTLDEAAFVQPGYTNVPCECECAFAPVHVTSTDTSYVNECVARQCNLVSVEDLVPGCLDGETFVVTADFTRANNHPDADACVQVQTQYVTSSLGFDLDRFVADVCASQTPPINGTRFDTSAQDDPAPDEPNDPGTPDDPEAPEDDDDDDESFFCAQVPAGSSSPLHPVSLVFLGLALAGLARRR